MNYSSAPARRGHKTARWPEVSWPRSLISYSLGRRSLERGFPLAQRKLRLREALFLWPYRDGATGDADWALCFVHDADVPHLRRPPDVNRGRGGGHDAVGLRPQVIGVDLQ